MGIIRKLLSKGSPEKIFLLIGAPALLAYMIVIPPLNGWDESTHFLRAYQISHGGFLPERFGKDHAGGKTPVNIVQMTDAAVSDVIASAQSDLAHKARVRTYARFLKVNRPDTVTVDKNFAGSAVYSPVSYAPQALGIFLARLLQLPLLLYVYAGRALNALVFLALAYWAIKISPRGKWLLAAVALLPTSLTAAATVSPDAIVNGTALLLIALFIKGLFSNQAIATKQLWLVAASVVVLSLAKETYFALALLPFFLPVKNYGNWRRYIGWNTAFVVLALVATFGWYAQVSDIVRISYLETQPLAHINSSGQEAYILHHPLTYTGLLLWQIFGHSNGQYMQMVGVLTWKGIKLPEEIDFITYFGLIIAFVWSYLEFSARPVLSKFQRWVTSFGPILLGFGLVCLIYTALYVSFNAVGSNDIQGVQGRYFIPLIGLLLPAVLMIKPSKVPLVSFNPQKLYRFFFWLFVVENVASVFVIFATNFIPGIQFPS